MSFWNRMFSRHREVLHSCRRFQTDELVLIHSFSIHLQEFHSSQIFLFIGVINFEVVLDSELNVDLVEKISANNLVLCFEVVTKRSSVIMGGKVVSQKFQKMFLQAFTKIC